LVDAWNLGNNSTTSTTLNGVDFVAVQGGSNPEIDGTFTLSASSGIIAGAFPTGNAPFSNFSPPYRKLLSGSQGGIQGGVPDLVLTISGLSPGDNYLFEWWSSATNFLNVSTTASSGNSVTLQSNASN